MEIMIKMQNCVESSYLVNSWLLNAFAEGLDIVALLDSPILSVLCNAGIIEHIDSWPNFHRDTNQMSENYEKTFMELMHDEVAYFSLFGHKFEEIENESRHLLS